MLGQNMYPRLTGSSTIPGDDGVLGTGKILLVDAAWPGETGYATEASDRGWGYRGPKQGGPAVR